MPGFLVILAGLPSSGKSTIAQAMKAHFPTCLALTCPAITIIDPDRFRGEKGEQLQFHPEEEPLIKQKVMEEAVQQLRAGHIAIIDDLNYYQSMRHDLLQIALKEDVPYLIIFVNTPIETCKAWNKKRGLKIPDEIIEKIALKFDYFERYTWDRPDFIINPASTDYSPQKFLQELCDFLKNNIERRPQTQVMNNKKVTQPASIKQLLDVRSRKILSEFLAEKTLQSTQKEFLKIRRDFIRKNPVNLEEIEQLLQEFRKILEIKAKEV